MERATYATKSFLIALALVKRHLTVEEAAVAARVEVLSQIQRWGEVEDCEFNIAVLRRHSLCNCLPVMYSSGTDYRLFYSSRR